MKYVFLFLLVTFVIPSESEAAKWRFRAREHYDIHKIKIEAETYEYQGLSNTINFWYEDPKKEAYGLAFGPLIGSARSREDVDPLQFGNKVQLFYVGAEYKKYFLEDFFVRPGLFWSSLETKGQLDPNTGYSAYLGIGYEIDVSNVGIALEVAFRQSYLQNDIEISTITPSIGVHFY